MTLYEAGEHCGTRVQGVRKQEVAEIVAKAFLHILHSSRVSLFVDGLQQHVSLACPLVRILMLNEVCITVV